MLEERRKRGNAGMAWTGLSLLALSCLAARPAWAHHEVRPVAGHAPGVGAYEAMSQARGIELRDAFNRPISLDKIERDLRLGARKVADQAADLSALSGLRAFLSYLDRAKLLASVWRGGAAAPGSPAEAVAASPRPSPKLRPLLAVVRIMLRDPGRLLTLSPLQLTTTPGRVRVLPMLL